jgi:hypothetical protein
MSIEFDFKDIFKVLHSRDISSFPSSYLPYFFIFSVTHLLIYDTPYLLRGLLLLLFNLIYLSFLRFPSRFTQFCHVLCYLPYLKVENVKKYSILLIITVKIINLHIFMSSKM